MDYTKTPRNKVYRDRGSIDDFDVDREGSIEKLMLERMYKEPYIYDLDGAEMYMLEIFNTAHYITTMILADPRPMMHFRFYMDTAQKIGAAPESSMNTYGPFLGAMAMAMVVNYLRVCDDKYNSGNNTYVQNIGNWYNEHCYVTGWGGKAYSVFFDNVMPNRVILKAREFMSREDFQPLPDAHVSEHNPDASVDDKINGTMVEEVAKFQTRIEELEKELEKKNEQLRGANAGSTEESAELRARIEELEKGMEALQKDNEKLRKSQKSMWKVSGETLLIGADVEDTEKKNEELRGANAGSTEESAELRARIEELENDLDALFARDNKSMMTASQAAIFLLTVCHNLGGIPNDKKKLSPILQRGWGFSEATAERALGAKATKEAAERVAALFRDISPKLERLINEFPDEFDRIKNQKLRDNNERKVKKS